MSPKVWARNPYNYIRECVEVDMLDLVWDQGILIKKSIDPYRFSMLYFGSTKPWTSMIITSAGAIEIDREHPLSTPVDTYPVWEYGDPLDSLMKNLDSKEHKKIIINGIRHPNQPVVKKFVRELNDIQEEYPETILHIHGSYSFFVLYGLNFLSVDFDPRNAAAMGDIILPSGRTIKQQYCSTEAQWVRLLGYSPVDLAVPRNRCMYNIKSNRWAAEHYKSTVNFETRKNKFYRVNPDSPRTIVPQKTPDAPVFIGKPRTLTGDKFLCNMCSLQSRCALFREGSVCIVPGSEPEELAKFFQTRDSDTIIDGLGTLLAVQSHRLEHAIRAEEDKNELHPETRKIINDLFDRGVKLAKLVNPALAAAGAAKINIQNNTANVLNGTPQALMAAVVEEFVRRGIPREDITPEMVLRVVQQPESVKQKAIDVAISEKTAREA